MDSGVTRGKALRDEPGTNRTLRFPTAAASRLRLDPQEDACSLLSDCSGPHEPPTATWGQTPTAVNICQATHTETSVMWSAAVTYRTEPFLCDRPPSPPFAELWTEPTNTIRHRGLTLTPPPLPPSPSQFTLSSFHLFFKLVGNDLNSSEHPVQPRGASCSPELPGGLRDDDGQFVVQQIRRVEQTSSVQSSGTVRFRRTGAGGYRLVHGLQCFTWPRV